MSLGNWKEKISSVFEARAVSPRYLTAAVFAFAVLLAIVFIVWDALLFYFMVANPPSGEPVRAGGKIFISQEALEISEILRRRAE